MAGGAGTGRAWPVMFAQASAQGGLLNFSNFFHWQIAVSFRSLQPLDTPVQLPGDHICWAGGVDSGLALRPKAWTGVLA